MTEKKRSADWYLAATHYLIAGFVVPAIISIVFYVVTIPLVGMTPDGNPVNPALQFPMYIVSVAVGVLSIWLGVKYSAGYLRKRYDLSHARRVVRLSTWYFVTIFVLFEIAAITSGYFTEGADVAGLAQYIGMDILAGIVGAYVFYESSKTSLR